MICRYKSFPLLLIVGAVALGLVGCVTTRPEEGAKVKSVEDIKSSVPKLSGLPLKTAQTVLSFVALTVGEVTLYDTDNPALHGQVFGQDPAPGTPVKGGTAVDVKVYRYVSGEKETPAPQAK